jgi:hypothetical protein
MIVTTDLTFMLAITHGGLFAVGIYLGYKLRKFIEQH